MRIFIDNEFKCHTKNGDGMRCVETPAFDGKCADFIEGHRFVPSGETWTRADGAVFTGEMVSPWKPHADLDVIQTAVDRTQDEADEKQMELLDIIEYLIMEG